MHLELGWLVLLLKSKSLCRPRRPTRPRSWRLAMASYGANLCVLVLALSPLSVRGWARQADKDALWELYEATNGPFWTRSSLAPDDPTLAPGGDNNWDLNTDPCPTNPEYGWYGVSCNDPCYYPIDGPDCRFGRITGVQLGYNNLEGTIPDSVFATLTNLTVVDLSHNSLYGTIPTTIGKLRNTVLMHLQMNSLSGTIPTEIRTIGSHVEPDEMADFFSLEDHPDDMGSGSGSGDHPYEESRGYGGGLSQFDLSHNNLNGTIPTTIGELVNLQTFDVSHNPELGADGCCDGADDFYKAFYGYPWSIPTEMGVLRKLQVLKMDHARFQRFLPTEIGKMRSLKFLRAIGEATEADADSGSGSGEAAYMGNEISGTIPTEIGRLTKLYQLVLGHNSISGTIPGETVNMVQLRKMTVEANRVSGTIPDIFMGTPELSHWDSYGNKMEGELPDSIGNLTNLDYLYMQNEHTGSMRNHHCKQRFDQSANGQKFNYQVLGNEHFSYKYISACANPLDVHGTFDTLDGDA